MKLGDSDNEICIHWEQNERDQPKIGNQAR